MNIGRKGYVKSMKLLIDTNVILDMVLKRNGYEISMELFMDSGD